MPPTARVSVLLLVAPVLLHAQVPPPVTSDTHDPAGHAAEVSTAVEYLARGTQLPGSPRRERVVTTVRAVSNANPRLNLDEGDVVRVTVRSGTWTVDSRKIQPVGVAGHVQETALHRDWGSRRMVRDLPFGRLLLRVGQGPWLDAGGDHALRVRTSGPVTLRINDDDDSLADNAGEVRVELDVERRGPLSAGGPGGGDRCGMARRALDEHLASLSTECAVDADCGAVPRFNPCDEMQVVRTRGARTAIARLEVLQVEAWQACGFLAPPCSRAPTLTRCVQKRCIRADPPPVPMPPPPEPAPRGCESVTCKPGEHCVMHQVHCARAPCPPLPMCQED